VRPNIQNVLKELNLLIHVIRFHVKSHLDNVSGVRIPKRSWIEAALADMKKQGAEIVEGIRVAEIDDPALVLGGCNRFKHDLKAYLAHLGPNAPMKSLDDILASQKFHPSIEKALLASQAASDLPPDQNPKCQEVAENERRLAQGVLKTMDDAKLDVVVYPSWNFPPRLIGDLNTPHGNNSPRVAPPTGFPAITVPMGFARGTLPAGLAEASSEEPRETSCRRENWVSLPKWAR
jgi:amidase